MRHLIALLLLLLWVSGTLTFAQKTEALKSETSYDTVVKATPTPTPEVTDANVKARAEKVTKKDQVTQKTYKETNYEIVFPPFKPGDTVTIVFDVLNSDKTQTIAFPVSMPTTDTIKTIYAEEYEKAKQSLAGPLKGLGLAEEDLVDAAIWQTYTTGEAAALNKLKDYLAPIIIGRGLVWYIYDKHMKEEK